jgi:hypothetical protein
MSAPILQLVTVVDPGQRPNPGCMRGASCREPRASREPPARCARLTLTLYAGSEATLADDIECFWLSGRGPRAAPAAAPAAAADPPGGAAADAFGPAAAPAWHRRSVSQDGLSSAPDDERPRPPEQPGSARGARDRARVRGFAPGLAPGGAVEVTGGAPRRRSHDAGAGGARGAGAIVLRAPGARALSCRQHLVEQVRSVRCYFGPCFGR